ncbi:uncharacterized protein LTR77_000877 [Saxophila tyrrhenica]|uniref:Cytochrome P450 n=1 Tax=Saxophila tyrrhenica TaxID=1690608 RepID=A0AAV9PTS3_9PEZI|nr:hypothetical protein LTR77_000877 [Saxophila tyrrhenica]
MDVLATVPRSAWYVALPFALVAALLSLIRVYTTWNYYRTIKYIEDVATRNGKAGKMTIQPPQIPYTIPFLGNALGFLDTTPGRFWVDLFKWHPRSSGACTLLLGGRRTHILYTPTVISAMFKDKTLKRDVFEEELYQKVFVMPEDQLNYAISGKHSEHEMNAAYMTRPERVNELTVHFTRVLEEVLDKDAEEIVTKDGIGLYNWLRDRMFTASTTALFGEEFFKYYPNYCEDFFYFDMQFMSFFFGFPMREASRRREQTFEKLQAWSKAMHEKSGGTPVDPEGPAWEPLFGSRLNRARQINYKERKLNARSSSALDLGITFGLSSNVIPATGWMLMNILNPKGDPNLLGRVLAELKEAEKSDGSIDVPVLINQPLIQSIWTETLRLYADVLITRNATQDTVLPMDEDGKTFIQLKKGDNVFAPSWIGHRDPEAWADDRAPTETFYADRFLQPDPQNPEKMVFSMTAVGKFYPFGGGRTICPGRVFAKQEALGALAMILLRFDFEVLGFVDKDGKGTEEFVQPALVYPGTAALAPGGDMKVRMRRRERLN